MKFSGSSVKRRFIPVLLLLTVFLILLYIALEVNKTARDEMVEHFQRQHEVIARQFAIGMEQIVRNTTLALVRMAKNIKGIPISDPHVLEELEITWDVMSSSRIIVKVELRDSGGEIVRRFPAYGNNYDGTKISGDLNRLLDGRKPVASDIFRTDEGDYVIFISVPVFGARGEIEGSLSALVSLDKLIERVFSALKQEEIGAFWILTQSGTVVFHSSHPGMTLRNIFDQKTGCNDCHGDFSIEKRMTKGEEGFGGNFVEGKEKLVAFSSIDFEDKKWSIAISNPIEKATGLLSSSTNKFIFFMVAFITVFFIAGFFILRTNEKAARAEEQAKNSERLLMAAEEKDKLDRELEQANRMAILGEMVARVAHEIKNPIQYIGTGFDLLKQEKDPAGRKEIIENIREGISTINAIVQELLNFSRPMKLERFSVDVRDLINEAVISVPEGIKVETGAGEGMPPVSVDGVKIKQMLMNLAGNSADSIREKGGGGIIRIHAAMEGGELVLKVGDNGNGIPPENIESIFVPFFTTKSKGVGLGMSIVQRIVELHGGAIKVKSEPGKGTEFEIRIPV